MRGRGLDGDERAQGDEISGLGPLMILVAYMPTYISDADFSLIQTD